MAVCLSDPQAVARGDAGDVDVASGQYVSAVKNVALFGSLLMIMSYEAELSKFRPKEASPAVSYGTVLVAVLPADRQRVLLGCHSLAHTHDMRARLSVMQGDEKAKTQ